MDKPAAHRWRDDVALGFATLLLAACGGAGDDSDQRRSSTDGPGDGEAVGIVLDAPQTVAGTNRIALAWRTQGAPTSFTVFLRRAAGEEFLAVTDASVGNDSARFARGAAWRYDWPTAAVRVRACTADQRCADSNEQPLLAALEAGIVALRPDPVPQAKGNFDNFGFDSEGSTLGLGTTPLSVFVRATDGRWSQDRSAPARSGDRSALSGDGNTLAIGLFAHRGTVGGVGAPEDEPPPGPDFVAESRGAVAVYVRDTTGAWQQQTFIKADVPTDSEYFGWNVALSGDGNRLAVSNQGGPESGDTRVYLYERNGGAWRLAWRFTNRRFRILQSGPLAISADGKTVAVPVYGWRVIDNPGGYGDGDQIPLSLVHVYRQCACQQSWELAAEFQSQRDTFTPLGSNDRYASTLSLSADGKALAVGAPEDSGGAGDDGTGPNQDSPRSGAVYLYGEGADRRWTRRAFLKTAAAPTQDLLGSHVQLRADGRALLASACGRDAGAAGLRRVHRADAQPPDIGSCALGANFYIFEADAEGRWTHTAAGLVPDANPFYGQVRASADLETIAAKTSTVRYDALIY